MAASRSSLARFLSITPSKTLSKSPPKAPPSSSMPKRKLSTRSRMMDDSDDDFTSFFRRPHPPASPLTLIAFYDGSGKDVRGRTLEEILAWGAGRLESSHDYIQTLFPLPEKSGVNDRAPIINKEVFEAFRSRKDLRDRMGAAFKKMLWFYGFELKEEDGKLSVIAGRNIKEHSQFWNSRFDHNHLRITRIIRCLRVLGLEKEALAFYDTMCCANLVSARSRMYWGRAAHRQLNFSPDLHESGADPEDRHIGPSFLFEFEQQQKELAKTLADSKGGYDVERAIQACQEGEVATIQTLVNSREHIEVVEEASQQAAASEAESRKDGELILRDGKEEGGGDARGQETNRDTLVNGLQLDYKKNCHSVRTAEESGADKITELQNGATFNKTGAQAQESKLDPVPAAAHIHQAEIE